MHFSQLLLVTAAGVAGVAAHPSGHAHLHQRFHEKRAEWITAVIYGKTVSWVKEESPFKHAHKPTPAAQPAKKPAATPAAAPAPAATPNTATDNKSNAGAGGGQGLGLFEAFGNCAAQKRSVPLEGLDKRATADQIAYKGNLGCNGYGSNIKMVKSTVADKYKYTIKVQGGGQAQECKVWNKIGPDGGINGFFKGNEAKTFNLPAGGEQYLAFDENSQGGMCCHPGSIPVTSFGQFLCPWTEFDFGSAANNKWSGFDASALVAGATNGGYRPLSVCTADGSTCSSLDANGGGHNAYTKGMEAKDGIGGNLAPGKVRLIAKVG